MALGEEPVEQALGAVCWQIARHMRLWKRAIELEAERFQAAGHAADTDLVELETHFFAIALNQVLRGGTWAKNVLEGHPEHRQVASAYNTFFRKVPDVVNVRHVLEHSIAHDTGADPDGSLKRNDSIPTPTPRGWDNGVFWISSSRGALDEYRPYTLNVADAAVEGVLLADAVSAAVAAASQRIAEA